ncbi:Fic family protein [Providencia burhodogranariea]
MPILEAKDSSEIENIVTTTDKLFQYINEDSHADAMTKEALRYRTALYEGYNELKYRPLCADTALTVCNTIKNTQMDIRKLPGTALKNQMTGEVIYTPPLGEQTITELLSNWEKFIHQNDDLDPLVKLALTHYQFEAIHPFTDGNGRTGRVINILFLIEKNLITLPILYLSRYIIKNRSDYYSLLLNVTKEDDWEPWILYMLSAIEHTSKWTMHKINAIRELMEHASSHIKNQHSDIYSYELLQCIFEQPYCRIKNLVDKNIARRQTASNYLKKSFDINILKEIQVGREKLFVNYNLINLMSDDQNRFEQYPSHS